MWISHKYTYIPSLLNLPPARPIPPLWSEVKSLSCVRLSVTPGTVACQAPLSMGFSRQEYWSGLPFPSPTSLCCHKSLGWAPCIIQQLPTSYLFYTWSCIYFSVTLSICPMVSFWCVHKFILCVYVSVAAPQIGSTVPFSRFHIYVLIFIFLFLISVCIKALGSSISVQLNEIHSFLWLSNILLYIYHNFFILVSMDI